MIDSRSVTDNYIGYTKLAENLPLTDGDLVLASSDILKIIIDVKEHGERFDANIFIDSLLQKVGPKGAILFPTFNWGFCRGDAFDINRTKSEVGALSNVALARKDFSRTRHPIYSFTVAGRHKEELCELDNISAWSEDSPFGFLCRNRGKTFSSI